MVNLLLFLLALTCFGIAAAWVAENPGTVTIYWFDYRIDTSFAFLIMLAVAFAFLMAGGYLLIRRLILMPLHVSQARKLKYYRHGFTELTYSVAALAAADIKGAETHTRKAQKLLGPTPLTLMLSAQVARSQGNDAKTRMLLEQMLEHKETEYLAARSLSDSASKQQHFPSALKLAERAYKVGPKDDASLAALVSLHVRMSQWQEALAAINKAARKGFMKKAKDVLRYRGLVHLMRGKSLLEHDRVDEAIAHARSCLKYLPAFAPAAVFAAEAYAADGQDRKAINVIVKTWKRTPHPQLSDELRKLVAGEPLQKRQKKLALLGDSTQELPGSEWVCSECNHAIKEWDVHCPSCGAFDTLQWK